ncbi:MAG: dodecin [Rhodospirillaceae bacterium]
MSDTIYKKVEIIGTSSVSIEDAIARGVAAAAPTDDEHHTDWFEVQEIRGAVRNGKVDQYQVVLKLGLRLKA